MAARAGETTVQLGSGQTIRNPQEKGYAKEIYTLVSLNLRFYIQSRSKLFFFYKILNDCNCFYRIRTII